MEAYWQTLALYRERPFKKLLVWARDPSKADHLGTRVFKSLPAVHIEPTTDLQYAVHNADVLITATVAREPIVRGEWLRQKQHITAVGADDPSKCELDANALKRARVFVDSVEANVANGDIFHAIQRGQYAADALAGEMGEVLAGRKPGRVGKEEITIAKFIGLGAQDLIACETALEILGIPIAP